LCRQDILGTGVPGELFIGSRIAQNGCSFQSQAGKQPPRSRVRVDLGLQPDVGPGFRLPPDRAGGNGNIGPESQLSLPLQNSLHKLVKVWCHDGAEAWMLIHLEVQTRRERGFARRMFVYNCRIADRYNREVVSLAVLADDDRNWRPGSYEWELWGCQKRLAFPVVKLLDYAEREAELEESRNPFARVVLAHLKALATRRDPESRRAWKFRLARGLYERGFRAEDVRQLFRLIDWLMELPPPAQLIFRQELDEYQEGRRMPFVTSIEREGMFDVIEAILRTKFGEEGAELLPAIHELNDAEKYLALSRAIATATTVDDVRRAYAQEAAPRPKRKRKMNKNGRSRRS